MDLICFSSQTVIWSTSAVSGVEEKHLFLFTLLILKMLLHPGSALVPQRSALQLHSAGCGSAAIPWTCSKHLQKQEGATSFTSQSNTSISNSTRILTDIERFPPGYPPPPQKKIKPLSPIIQLNLFPNIWATILWIKCLLLLVYEAAHLFFRAPWGSTGSPLISGTTVVKTQQHITVWRDNLISARSCQSEHVETAFSLLEMNKLGLFTASRFNILNI